MTQNVLFGQQQQQPQFHAQPGSDSLAFQQFSYGSPQPQQPPLTSYAASYDPGYPPSSFSPAADMASGVSWQSIRDAFSAGGFADEPPLLEELGINFDHIRSKSLAVLNPFRQVDQHIMDDTDLAGPLIFCFLFGGFLLLSSKVQFGYIYGVAMLGWFSMYALLNLMSERGIDGYRTASVLGYSLLPMVILSLLSIALNLRTLIGFVLSATTALWCTHSASAMFVSVLSMSDQRLLVAYPVGLLYSTFALLVVF